MRTTGGYWWRAAFVLAVIGQFAALYWPRTPSVATGLPLDKVVHIVLFGGVALLGVLAGVPLRWLVPGLLAQILLSELVQGLLLPGRGAELWDAVADLAGIGLGIAVGRALTATKPAVVQDAGQTSH